jgi:hypothetical protein
MQKLAKLIFHSESKCALRNNFHLPGSRIQNKEVLGFPKFCIGEPFYVAPPCFVRMLYSLFINPNQRLTGKIWVLPKVALY